MRIIKSVDQSANILNNKIFTYFPKQYNKVFKDFMVLSVLCFYIKHTHTHIFMSICVGFNVPMRINSNRIHYYCLHFFRVLQLTYFATAVNRLDLSLPDATAHCLHVRGHTLFTLARLKPFFMSSHCSLLLETRHELGDESYYIRSSNDHQLFVQQSSNDHRLSFLRSINLKIAGVSGRQSFLFEDFLRNPLSRAK